MSFLSEWHVAPISHHSGQWHLTVKLQIVNQCRSVTSARLRSNCLCNGGSSSGSGSNSSNERKLCIRVVHQCDKYWRCNCVLRRVAASLSQPQRGCWAAELASGNCCAEAASGEVWQTMTRQPGGRWGRVQKRRRGALAAMPSSMSRCHSNWGRVAPKRRGQSRRVHAVMAVVTLERSERRGGAAALKGSTLTAAPTPLPGLPISSTTVAQVI